MKTWKCSQFDLGADLRCIDILFSSSASCCDWSDCWSMFQSNSKYFPRRIKKIRGMPEKYYTGVSKRRLHLRCNYGVQTDQPLDMCGLRRSSAVHEIIVLAFLTVRMACHSPTSFLKSNTFTMVSAEKGDSQRWTLMQHTMLRHRFVC